ncbi:MAG: transketolase [Bacteroidetes bacterium]|nr:transketolase [Bacteroidota bacterium]
MKEVRRSDTASLLAFTKQVRRDIIQMIEDAGSGHPGGSLSSVEILSVLYKRLMNYQPNNPDWKDRDRFILSKGHAAPVLYSVLARCGFFDPEILRSFRKFGSPLQGHPSMEKLAGLDYSGGSLGQGLSFANGVAYGLKIKKSGAKVYVLVGDGEIQEGQNWEAMMTSSQQALDNLVLIVDSNNLQIDGVIGDIKGLAPLDKKIDSFGFHTLVVDGHDMNALENAFQEAGNTKGKPTAIIAQTVKGKGVSFLENQISSHHRTGFTLEEKQKAYIDIEKGDTYE